MSRSTASRRVSEFVGVALFAAALGFHAQQFFDLGETRAQVEQAPEVKF